MSKFLYRQLAGASNNTTVDPGQEVFLQVDLALAHDGTGPALMEQWKQKNGRISKCKKVLFTFDHAFPAPTVKDRKFQKEFAEFSTENGFCLYQHGEGVLHQVVAEEHALWPGMIIAGADGHVATAGAFGAIAFSVSADKLIAVLESGLYQTVVPEQITISLEGSLPKSSQPRDVALAIVKMYHTQIRDKGVALTGSLLKQISLAGKMSICNYLPEAGVATAFILPDGENDQADCVMQAEDIQPLLAVPPSPAAIRTVAEMAGIRITAAIAGGCSAGRLEDMLVIADVLSGKKVYPGVTFVVTPASRKVLDAMEAQGISKRIREAGAIIMPPGCGSCPGRHFGVLDDDDVAITTTIRNNPGRLGAEGAQIYLASPLTVALSALNGSITAP